MGTIKTAISLGADLFREAEGVARRMKVSRSRLFATAMREFIERRRNQQILEAINAAYTEPPDPGERRLRRSIRRQHQRGVQGKW